MPFLPPNQQRQSTEGTNKYQYTQSNPSIGLGIFNSTVSKSQDQETDRQTDHATSVASPHLMKGNLKTHTLYNPGKYARYADAVQWHRDMRHYMSGIPFPDKRQFCFPFSLSANVLGKSFGISATEFLQTGCGCPSCHLNNNSVEALKETLSTNYNCSQGPSGFILSPNTTRLLKEGTLFHLYWLSHQY